MLPDEDERPPAAPPLEAPPPAEANALEAPPPDVVLPTEPDAPAPARAEPPADAPPDAPSVIDDEDTDTEPSAALNPAKLRIETKLLTIDQLLRRIVDGGIELPPATDAAAAAAAWTRAAQSRLVESLLVRIPLPAFYIDATTDARWRVIDGGARLNALHSYATKDEFALTGLEFLADLRGKRFSELPRQIQRRIQEAQVTLFLVQPGTPAEMVFSVFARVHTGGPPRSPAAIRDTLYRGPGTTLLERVTAQPEFVRLVGRHVRHLHAADREFALRFLSFAVASFGQYTAPMHGFLNAQMERINQMGDADLQQLEARFARAMRAAHALLGDDAFRRDYGGETAARGPLNRALFEAWTVNLDALPDDALAQLLERAPALRDAAAKLLRDRPDVDRAVSRAAHDPAHVALRFEAVGALIGAVVA